MKRIIAGGTGFIGSHLVKHWQNKYELIILGRDKTKIQKKYPRLQALTWDELKIYSQKILPECDIIVNLAGANIGAKFWSNSRKKIILASRVETTKTVAAMCALLGSRSPKLLNASAVGIYGLQENISQGLPPAYDETTSIDFAKKPDFLAEVARAWEQATEPAKSNGVPTVNMRFGIVLSRNGGVLPKLALPFHFGLGGKIGSGQQPISWIHIDDLINAIDFVITNPITGPINFAAPQTVTQMEFAKTLGKVLHRPTLLSTPAFILKIILGKMAEELLLRGQHVYPKRLLDAGFTFKFPDLLSALKQIYNKT